ncbi:hypothetical protein O6P43_013759 [Quillaja saponaria]|uniref:Secreted protein n=1 Tax=Quillaja saponaria TaxID=32244 RepID=A0AAD7PQK0_QUISA|nr:hypothetical protein O6P43_013759 [Quillaja saponaria]
MNALLNHFSCTHLLTLLAALFSLTAGRELPSCFLPSCHRVCVGERNPQAALAKPISCPVFSLAVSNMIFMSIKDRYWAC